MSTFRDLRDSASRRTSDNCSVSLGYYGPELYAMTETNRVWRVNQEDLGAEKQVGEGVTGGRRRPVSGAGVM